MQRRGAADYYIDMDPRCSRYRSLDLWRGVACLLVVVFHSTFYSADQSAAIWLTQRMWVGVSFFFVISGYCIAATADSTRRKGVGTLVYFQRRFRRIYPPFWAVVVAAAVVVACAPQLFSGGANPIRPPGDFTFPQWLGNLSLTESWSHFARWQPESFFLAHSWTLCYEEQFYAVTGLLLLVARRHFFAGAAAVSVLTVLVSRLGIHYRWPVQGFFFDGFWLTFAAGILVYYCINYAGARRRKLLIALLAAAALFAARHPSALLDKAANFSQFSFAAFVFALLLLAMHRWDRQLCNSPWTQPLMYFGTLCYSLYLVHWPVVKALSQALYFAGVRSSVATMLLTVPACLAASVLAGWAFHIAVERRFLNAPLETARRPAPTVSSEVLSAV